MTLLGLVTRAIAHVVFLESVTDRAWRTVT